MKNSLQWRHLQEEGKFMARPQHSPTPSSTQAPATPFESRTRTKPEEKHLCRRWTKKIPKKDPQVLLQAGRIKPISDRSPQLAGQNPEVYLSSVANTLNNLGILDWKQNRMEATRQGRASDQPDVCGS